MTRSLGSYAEYKKTEIPGLAAIPAHWKIARLKHLADMRSGQSITSEDISKEGRYPVYGGNGLRGYTTSFTHDGEFVLIGRQGALCGNINYAESQFWASEHAVVATPIQRYSRYWFGEVLRYLDLNQYSISAAQPGLAVDRIRTLQIPVPPFHEQEQIARYLQYKANQINVFIRNKRRLIALLNEEKQAIIQQAVTRGLDPDVPMMPSGVEWLGEIPAHWNMRRGKFVLRETDERSTDGSEELLSVSHLTGVTPRSEKTITMFKAESYVGHKIARPDDLVINTMWAWMGALGVSEHSGLVSPGYGTYRQLAPVAFENRFLDLMVRTPILREVFHRRSTGIRSSRLRLYPDEFLDISFPVPPLDDQRTILHEVAERTRPLDKAISDSNRQIDLIREYRTRLIADVVTGQLDVRNVETANGDWSMEPSMESASELLDEVETDTDEFGDLKGDEEGVA